MNVQYATSSHKMLLLVEDQPDDQVLTIRALRQSSLGTQIAVAHDGVEALDFLFARGDFADRAGKPLPVLVILDLKLPRLDGLGVLRALRADTRTRLIPVIVMTSSKEEQDVITSYELGANSYVRKPVDFAEFLEAARLLGVYWLVVNQQVPGITRS